MLYKQIKVHPYSPVWRGEQQPPKVANIGNINNMPNRRYLPSINFSVPFARWSDFYVSMAQNHQGANLLRQQINYKNYHFIAQVNISKY
jgi:hypothetical protein